MVLEEPFRLFLPLRIEVVRLKRRCVVKSTVLVAALTLVGLGLLSEVGQTDGCLMPSGKAWKIQREKALINEPDQKALIFFRDGTEQLVISPSFDGATGDFAWVVPVPARPKVKVLEGAPFHELARLVEPAPPRSMSAKMSAPAAGRPSGPVTVLERKTVGDYDVSVLSSTDANALMHWLETNSYHLPPKAEAPMQEYVKKGWTFVACRIKAPKSAQGLHKGTLTPLRLIFPASKPIYPMRLSSANPEPFMMLVYLVMPSGGGGGISRHVTPTISVATAPDTVDCQKPRHPAALFTQENRRSFPTLAGLSRFDLNVYFIRTEIRPEDCTQDIAWNTPTTISAK